MIKYQNVKINPYHFLLNTDNLDCIKALQTITSRIDLIRIKEIIENTPYISDLHKEFLFTMVKERKNKILDVAVEKHFSSIRNEELLLETINFQDDKALFSSEPHLLKK